MAESAGPTPSHGHHGGEKQGDLGKGYICEGLCSRRRWPRPVAGKELSTNAMMAGAYLTFAFSRET